MRNARDLWTHWSPTARRQLDGRQAMKLSVSLAAVLTGCILAELGFEDELRGKIIRQSDDYRWAALLGGAVSPGT